MTHVEIDKCQNSKHSSKDHLKEIQPIGKKKTWIGRKRFWHKELEESLWINKNNFSLPSKDGDCAVILLSWFDIDKDE